MSGRYVPQPGGTADDDVDYYNGDDDADDDEADTDDNIDDCSALADEHNSSLYDVGRQHEPPPVQCPFFQMQTIATDVPVVWWAVCSIPVLCKSG